MRLFHDPASTTSRAVTLFAAEAGIALDLVYVGLAQGEHHATDFAALNPNRQVPVLDDDGFVLTESAAILRYLADQAGSPAYPVDRRARAIVDARLDWFNTGFARDAAYGLVYPALIPDLRPTQPEAAAQLAHMARQKTETWLSVLDRHWIGDHRFAAGDRLTIADYLGAAYVSLLEIVGFDLTPYPSVVRWMAAMRKLPHWAECYAAFDGLLSAIHAQHARTAGKGSA
jgi:glutathione S-transferase